jgi:hypothetical protein
MADRIPSGHHQVHEALIHHHDGMLGARSARLNARPESAGAFSTSK